MELIDRKKSIIAIKGAGEMATGVAVRLKNAGFSRIFMVDIDTPQAVRRSVSFSEAVYGSTSFVEGIEAVLVPDVEGMYDAWKKSRIAILVDPRWQFITQVKPQIVIDAIIAKKNLGTTIDDGALVIGLGPGFSAGIDAHRVIETMRGHDLGRVLSKGAAMPNTGIPGNIGGYTIDRVLRSPAAGIFQTHHNIADLITVDEVVAKVEGHNVVAQVDGVIRGLVRDGITVHKGMKIGDIDPRGQVQYCYSVSEKSRAIGGAVLEAILGYFDLAGEKGI